MSISHLCNGVPPILSIICANGDFDNVNVDDTITSTTINSTNVNSTIVNSTNVNSTNVNSIDCNISNNLTTKNFQMNDTLMLYNESKVNAKISGETANFVITDGSIFKHVIRQDSASHYIKKYTYIMNAQNTASISSLGCTIQLDPFEYGQMIMTGYSVHYDIIASNNNQYHGVLTQSGQNITLSVQLAPPPVMPNQGRLYVEFYTVLSK